MGRAAMTVVFINYAPHILNSQMSRIAGKLGFAPRPLAESRFWAAA